MRGLPRTEEAKSNRLAKNTTYENAKYTKREKYRVSTIPLTQRTFRVFRAFRRDPSYKDPFSLVPACHLALSA